MSGQVDRSLANRGSCLGCLTCLRLLEGLAVPSGLCQVSDRRCYAASKFHGEQTMEMMSSKQFLTGKVLVDNRYSMSRSNL